MITKFFDFSLFFSSSPFLSGLFCGLILSIPLCTTGLISLYTLFNLGVWAGFISFLGAIIGECIFLSLIAFGAYWGIQFWISWFPTIFFIGNIFAAKMFFQFSLSPFYEQTTLRKNIEFIKIFTITFALSFANISLINISHLIFDLKLLNSNFLFIFGIFIGQISISSIFCLTLVDIFLQTNNFISRLFVRSLSIRKFSEILGYIGLSLLIQANLNFPWNGYFNYFLTNQNSSFQFHFLPDSRFSKFKRELNKRYKAMSKTKEVSLSVYLLTNYGENFQDPNSLSQFPLATTGSINDIKLEKTLAKNNDVQLKSILTSKIANIGISERFNDLKVFHKIERVSKPFWKKGQVCNLVLYKDFYFIPEKIQNVQKTGLEDKPGIVLSKLSEPDLMNQYFAKNYFLHLKTLNKN
uniref:Hypothetical chloroplast RF1 n=1 Tax=Verdigellas peltata TaxID=542676 RepID=A0A161KK88_9VIRI|nr:hypothetical chloroplast RF1 [Verdigellas peltata]CZF96665.1 hypothetical chloroplast RF1 [Verdigellas peltata]